MLITFMIVAVGAGFAAGSVGQGGGSIFNPLLISFKVHPAVAAASGMYMIMFSSFANTFMYVLSGYLHIGFGFW